MMMMMKMSHVKRQLRSCSRRHCLKTLAALMGSAAMPRPGATELSSATALQQLAERYFQAVLESDPFEASWIGLDTPEQASRLRWLISPTERAAYRKTLQGLQTELRGLQRPVPLDPAQDLLWQVLDYSLQDGLANLDLPDHLLPLDQMGESPLFLMAGAADNGLGRWATLADHRHHLARLAQLPAWCRQAEANLREGLRQHIVWPRVIIERTLPMLRELVDAPAARHPFLAPLLQHRPAGVSPADLRWLSQSYHGLLSQQLRPAMRRLLSLLQREVLPRAPTHGAGLGNFPGGGAWYAQCIRSATTTRLSAEHIHALGLSEVQRLREEMARVTDRLGLTGSHAERLARYQQRPALYPFKTEAAVLAAYRQLDERIAPGLGRLFRRVPRAPLEIHAEPALTRDTASDHYSEPAADGSRPGVFFAVIPDPARVATTGMTTLFLHEGRPGHHYQIALAQELPLTRMQRFLGNNAYVEGWALYAETLGHELGLYEHDPDAHLGHLTDAMLRAVRLVVDTGLHALGWSREQALHTLAEATGYDEQATRAQIERYMVNPGQALGYAVGRLRIEAARDRARQALGSGFQLADFHEQVLNQGPLPLDVLDAHLDRWISASAPLRGAAGRVG